MKRAVPALLILILLLSCLPFAQAAETPVTILLGSDFQNNCYSTTVISMITRRLRSSRAQLR